MSKKSSKTNTKEVFTYTPKSGVPKIQSYPVQWDMKKLYYSSISDSQIEADVQTTEKMYRAFVKKFRDSDFTSNAKTLLSALNALDKIENTPAHKKPIRYLSLLSTLDSSNEKVNKKLNLISDRLTKAENTLLFFGLQLAKTNQANQKKFLQDASLSHYHYYLKKVFEEAKHHLAEAEEKILNLTQACSYGMWVDGTEKMLGHKQVTYQGKDIPLNEAVNMIGSLAFADRPKLWKEIMAQMQTLDEVVENELTAIITKKKITDELRGYKKPYSASVLEHEDDEKSVEAMIEAVSTRGFKLSKKFYSLKAKLHGVKQLDYSQRNASIATIPTIPFTQATDICRDVFYSIDQTYGETFDELLSGGHIDVYPKKGKQGGAFMSSSVAKPTNVFLNQLDNFSSLTTYAHEMGHAIHSIRSKTQPAHYQRYSTTTAETASTLFEGLLLDAIFEQVDDETRAVLLHDKIAGDISTIQRQIAFHNFELDMHNHVREQGAITRTELNSLMQKHLKSYMGPGVSITEQDGYSYVYVSHFRLDFYVYTYTFGKLMSTVMTESYKHDERYIDKIDSFLQAGNSDSVEHIFKNIGLHTKKIETFLHGLDKMGAEIKELSQLIKKTS